MPAAFSSTERLYTLDTLCGFAALSAAFCHWWVERPAQHWLRNSRLAGVRRAHGQALV
ncbi:hypothetical protein ACI2KC_15410 [Pseudomonas monteilii]